MLATYYILLHIASYIATKYHLSGLLLALIIIIVSHIRFNCGFDMIMQYISYFLFFNF